jgi:apolipoprotein N-acyltransferase
MISARISLTIYRRERDVSNKKSREESNTHSLPKSYSFGPNICYEYIFEHLYSTINRCLLKNNAVMKTKTEENLC